MEISRKKDHDSKEVFVAGYMRSVPVTHILSE
jgi:hypothetical protein